MPSLRVVGITQSELGIGALRGALKSYGRRHGLPRALVTGIFRDSWVGAATAGPEPRLLDLWASFGDQL